MTLHKPIPQMSDQELGAQLLTIAGELTQLNEIRRCKAAEVNLIHGEIGRRKEGRLRKQGSCFAPAVSDHAVVRYMERAMGFDIDGLRQKILSPGLIIALRTGAARFSDADVVYILGDNTVITIVERHRGAA